MDAESRRTRFEEVAAEVVEPLRRFLARRTDPDTAEDVLADALLVCWRRIEEVPEAPLPWAYAVTRHCLSNVERGERRRRRLRARLASAEGPAGPVAAGAEDLPAGAAEIRAALATLRPDDAEILRLWAWEDLTPTEIAVVLDITANAASVRLHRARQRLRERLGKTGVGAGHEGSTEGSRP